MTRNEILAMEAGRELDALLAVKLLGWRWIWPGEPHVAVFSNVREYEVPFEQDCLFEEKPESAKTIGDNYRLVPPLSETWEGMRLVVEAMKLKGRDLQLIGSDQWNARFWLFAGDGTGYSEANADTAPHAVALAAMLAVGGGDAN